ncbi:MAG: hypothetical protein ACMV1B_11590 [Prevotella sp.]
MNKTIPKAIQLADQFEVKGFLGEHRFAKEQWCAEAAIELRALHAANMDALDWYDAARSELDAARVRIAELESLLGTMKQQS